MYYLERGCVVFYLFLCSVHYTTTCSTFWPLIKFVDRRTKKYTRKTTPTSRKYKTIAHNWQLSPLKSLITLLVEMLFLQAWEGANTEHPGTFCVLLFLIQHHMTMVENKWNDLTGRTFGVCFRNHAFSAIWQKQNEQQNEQQK